MAHLPRAASLGFVALSAALSANAPLGCSALSNEEIAGEDVGSEHSAGVSPDALGINVATNAPGGGAIEKLGAKWVRVELVDQTTGSELSDSAVSHVQETLADYHAHGIRVLLLVDYQTRAGFGGEGVHFCPSPAGDWDGYRKEWLARVEHAAKTLGDSVDAWQIWNEPDHPCNAAEGYEPGLPGGVFGSLQHDAYWRIKAHSSSPVVNGGLASGNSGYVDDMLAATGGSLSDIADGVAIHIYGVVPNDAWCAKGGLAIGEGNLNCAWGRLDGKVYEYGKKTGLPVWVTEVGLKTEDTGKQAQYLEDAHNAFSSTGSMLERVFWFAYSDAMVKPFGLTDTNWSPKPDVYARYQMIAGKNPQDNGAAPGDAPPADDSAPQDNPPQDGVPDEMSCGDLAAKNGWEAAYCEWNGNGACGGQGAATNDCDHCCEVAPAEEPADPEPQLSCGEVADLYGFASGLCEWNGNGACGGNGVPTWDCDYCCDGG